MSFVLLKECKVRILFFLTCAKIINTNGNECRLDQNKLKPSTAIDHGVPLDYEDVLYDTPISLIITDLKVCHYPIGSNHLV